jgi:hypothetical protein
MPANLSNSPGKQDGGFLRWLGRQVGFVKKAIDTDVNGPKTIYRDKQVEEIAHPRNPDVKLRRTIIDEVIQEKPKEK